jgi:hypothetical protein
MTIMKYALIPHFHFAPSYAVAQSIFDNPKKMLAGDVPFFFRKKNCTGLVSTPPAGWG